MPKENQSAECGTPAIIDLLDREDDKRDEGAVPAAEEGRRKADAAKRLSWIETMADVRSRMAVLQEEITAAKRWKR